MKHCRKLKRLDIFKQRPGLLISDKYSGYGEVGKNMDFFYRSWPGMMMSVVVIIILLGYFTNLTIYMFNRSKSLSHSKLINTSEYEGSKEFKIYEQELMPNIEIGILESS